MDENSKRHLYKFYDLLYNNLERKKKVKKDSIILSFLKMSLNFRNEFMNASSIHSSKIPDRSLDLLLEEELIQTSSNIDNFVITSKGVWIIENERGKINEESLLDYINAEYFTEQIKPVDSREKIILFSMIAARTFSEKSAVDLKKDDSIADQWKEIIDVSADKLCSLGFVSEEDISKLYGKPGNEHVVSGLFRRNTALPRKIKGIYKFTRDKRYYLDLCDDSKISQEKLSYLFWILFNGNVSSQKRDEILTFYNEISSKKSIFVFDVEEHPFSMYNYDFIIRDCLMDSIISKRKWEARV